jgi:ribosomal protein L29
MQNNEMQNNEISITELATLNLEKDLQIQRLRQQVARLETELKKAKEADNDSDMAD